jgi:hypothetical protein
MGRVLAASAPKWATVLSGSRKSLRAMATPRPTSRRLSSVFREPSHRCCQPLVPFSISEVQRSSLAEVTA